MRKILVLGPGCARCKTLAKNAEQAAAQAGECRVEKITDIATMTRYGVMATPALVIDDKVVAVGKVLSPGEIEALLAGD